MVEEQTGTEMLFEEQEKNTETQEINSDDQEDNLSEETDVDLEVQENAPEINEADPEVQENAPGINEADPGEIDNTGETEKVENIESSVETENQTAASHTHLRAHETSLHLVCRLLPEKIKPTDSPLLSITPTKHACTTREKVN